MALQHPTIDPATTSPASDISKIKNDLAVISAVIEGGTDSDLVPTWLPQTPRTQVVASGATLTPAVPCDLVARTAQAVALTINNPTGTLADGDGFLFRFKDDGTARGITWSGSKYRGVGGALPNTTTAGKTMYMPVVYNADEDKIDVMVPASVVP